MHVILHDLVKRYGDKCVLNNVNLDFSPGVRYAIVGSSGIGKTTLLRLIAGLEKPDSGSVEVPAGAVTSYAFQEPRLFPMLTATENIEAITPERDSREILSSLNLLREANSYPSSLSGGMKKRAGLARALAKQADIYLIDEPTGGQDAHHCAMVCEAILAYTKDSVCIVSTHDAELVSAVADVMIVLGSHGADIHDVSDKTTDEIRALMK